MSGPVPDLPSSTRRALKSGLREDPRTSTSTFGMTCSTGSSKPPVSDLCRTGRSATSDGRRDGWRAGERVGPSAAPTSSATRAGGRVSCGHPRCPRNQRRAGSWADVYRLRVFEPATFTRDGLPRGRARGGSRASRVGELATVAHAQQLFALRSDDEAQQVLLIERQKVVGADPQVSPAGPRPDRCC
jgi:hypothetical protein